MSEIANSTFPKTAISEQFLLVEYEKAAEAYFHGVSICLNWIKSFFFINGILLATIGAVSKLKDDTAAPSILLWAIPLAGIVMSIALISFIPFWNKQLTNCRTRCEELEKKFGGDLYTRIGRTTSPIGAGAGIFLIALLILVIWAVLIWFQAPISLDFVLM